MIEPYPTTVSPGWPGMTRALIYGFCGGTAYVQISQALLAGKAAEIGTTVGLVFVVAGLAFKIAAVPFHMWTPDVYEGAPTPVTAFFAVATKIAGVSLLVSVLMGPFKPLFPQWQQIIVAAAGAVDGPGCVRGAPARTTSSA